MVTMRWRSISSASYIRACIVVMASFTVLSAYAGCPHCINKTRGVAKKVAPIKKAPPLQQGRRVQPPRAIVRKRFSWPLRRDKFWISCFYGRKARGRLHAGLDMAAVRGTPIYAAESGVVESVTNSGSYGNMILVRHDNNYKSRYAHLWKFAVRSGRYVKKGSLLGYVGNSGNVRGSNGGHHLHFEILCNGSPINPIRYLS